MSVQTPATLNSGGCAENVSLRVRDTIADPHFYTGKRFMLGRAVRVDGYRFWYARVELENGEWSFPFPFLDSHVFEPLRQGVARA